MPEANLDGIYINKPVKNKFCKDCNSPMNIGSCVGMKKGISRIDSGTRDYHGGRMSKIHYIHE